MLEIPRTPAHKAHIRRRSVSVYTRSLSGASAGERIHEGSAQTYPRESADCAVVAARPLGVSLPSVPVLLAARTVAGVLGGPSSSASHFS